MARKPGSLMVVGTGIKGVGQITLEARGWIEQADHVLYAVADPVTAIWIKRTNAHTEDLGVYYADEKPRIATYQEMTEAILRRVRAGLDVCAVFYGHPGILVWSSRQAIRIARAEGYRAGMLPGVSALDCLFVDLGVDPAVEGCQMFEANDFLLHHYPPHTNCPLILWQIAAVGEPGFRSAGPDARHLPILVEALQQVYGTEYEIVHYQAAKYAIRPPAIQRLPLSQLTPATVTALSTLYIPAHDVRRANPVMAERLGLSGAPIARERREEAVVPYRPARPASRLAEVLSELSQNPRLLAAFNRDPAAVLARYDDLSEEERVALLSGQPRRIREAMLAPTEG